MTAPDQTNAEVSDERLRKCPFCGEEAVLLKDYAGSAIECLGCGAKGAIGNTTEQTISAWNRRSVTSQASEGEVVAWQGDAPDGRRGLTSNSKVAEMWKDVGRTVTPLYASPVSKRVERLETALRNALPAYEDWMDDHADDVKSATCRQLTFGEIRSAYALLQALQGGRS